MKFTVSCRDIYEKLDEQANTLFSIQYDLDRQLRLVAVRLKEFITEKGKLSGYIHVIMLSKSNYFDIYR